jgi:hypothetical protein
MRVIVASSSKPTYGWRIFPLSHVPSIILNSNRNKLDGHGMGKHRPEEIYAIGNADLIALSDFLGEKTFFFGSEPTSLDASAYDILANILWEPLDSPLREKAQQLENLGRYCDRIRDRYYPTDRASGI